MQVPPPGIAVPLASVIVPPLATTLDLKPALSLHSRIVAVKGVKPGEGSGYGIKTTFSEPRTVAVVPAGYADGLDLRLAGRGFIPPDLGVVLVQRVDAHAVGRGVACLGDRFAPGVVPLVADADPVDRHKHDGCLIVGPQDYAAGRKRVADVAHGWDEAVAQRRTDWRRDVHFERGDA